MELQVTFGELATGINNARAQKWHGKKSEDENWGLLFTKEDGDAYKHIKNFEFKSAHNTMDNVELLNDILGKYSGIKYHEEKEEIYEEILNVLADKAVEDGTEKADVIEKMAGFFSSYDSPDGETNSAIFRKIKGNEDVAKVIFGDYIIPQKTPSLKEALTQIVRYISFAYRHGYDKVKFENEKENEFKAAALIVTFNE